MCTQLFDAVLCSIVLCTCVRCALQWQLQFDITGLLHHICTYIGQGLEYDASFDPEDGLFLFKWLQLAEKLQLDELKRACFKGLRTAPYARIKTMTHEQMQAALAPLTCATVASVLEAVISQLQALG